MPSSRTRRPLVAEILGEKAVVFKNPVGHFDIYRGELFDKAVPLFTAGHSAVMESPR